ncbi:peptide MFS transporter [Chitinophaga agrisoli]|nr:peptide MFS transporter [Chitinophaga agrisoli]
MSQPAVMQAPVIPTTQRKGHPKGLAVLFSAEMWERFTFYGNRALLTLFLVSALGFSQEDSSIIYGGFLGMGWLTAILGGFVADRYLGNRACIILGGLTMSLGQLFMFTSGILYATNVETARMIMWAGLGVLILGNGFFKPNISSMVGQLYPKGDNRLDSAFTIFYMGINLGALLGITICPILGDVKHFEGAKEIRDITAFKWGFLAASIAMLVGTVMFYFLKDKYVVSPEGEPVGTKPKKGDSDQAQFSNKAIAITVVAEIILMAIFYKVIGVNLLYAFIYSTGISLGGLILSDKSLNSVERQRIIVIYIISFFVIFFWACFEQAGSSLTFIADQQTDRRLFGWDMPPSLIQNAQSLTLIALAIPFSFLWLRLQKMKMDPISPVKQAIGLGLLAVGYWIIALQVKDLGNAKLGVIWLFVLYLFHTLGELSVSPIGLSLVSKLAPKRFTSLLMGVFFLSNASGYALAGTLGTLLPPTAQTFGKAAEKGIDLPGILNGAVPLTAQLQAQLKTLQLPSSYPQFAGFTIHNLYEFFMLFVILPGVAAILLFLLSFFLKKMMHGVR